MKTIEIEEYDYIQFVRVKKQIERAAGQPVTDSNVIGYLLSLEMADEAPSDVDFELVATRYLEDKEIYNLLHDLAVEQPGKRGQ